MIKRNRWIKATSVSFHENISYWGKATNCTNIAQNCTTLYLMILYKNLSWCFSIMKCIRYAKVTLVEFPQNIHSWGKSSTRSNLAWNCATLCLMIHRTDFLKRFNTMKLASYTTVRLVNSPKKCFVQNRHFEPTFAQNCATLISWFAIRIFLRHFTMTIFIRYTKAKLFIFPKASPFWKNRQFVANLVQNYAILRLMNGCKNDFETCYHNEAKKMHKSKDSQRS